MPFSVPAFSSPYSASLGPYGGAQPSAKPQVQKPVLQSCVSKRWRSQRGTEGRTGGCILASCHCILHKWRFLWPLLLQAP